MGALFAKYKYWLLILLAALLYIVNQSRFEHGDFKVFLAAADYLYHGQNPYKVWLVWQGKLTDTYFYGPAFAAILIPLTGLPEQYAYIIFFFIQAVLLLRAFYVIKAMLPLYQLTQRQQIIWWLLAVGCSLRFILHNAEFGQVTILIFCLAIEGLYQIFYGRKLLGAVILGLAIHIKVMPLVFIPYLIWRKEFKAALLTCSFFFIFWLTPLAFGNTAFAGRLFADWCYTVNPAGERYTVHQEKLGWQMQGLQALYSAWLLDSDFGIVKFNIAVLSDIVFELLLQGSRLILVLFTFFFLQSLYPRPYTKDGKGLRELSYLFLVMPLIFPQQQKYSFLMMTPFFAYMAWWILANRKADARRWRMVTVYFALLVLLTTFTSDLFVGQWLNSVFQCTRELTIAAMLGIPLLALADPAVIKPGQTAEAEISF